MSRFIRAVVGAVVLAAALPAVANAATVEMGGKMQNAVVYRAAAGEVNDVRVTSPGKGVVISDSVPIKLGDDDCRINSSGDAVCLNGTIVFIELGDRNDRIEHVTSVGGRIDAGSGNDLFVAGKRELTRPRQGLIDYLGGEGVGDKISYATTNRPVNVTVDAENDDGRAGENESVGDDIEIIEGSPFNDTITGSNDDHRERFFGLAGNDTINGLGGDDVFHEDRAANGSDTFNGGAGIDLIDYSLRTQAVNVTLDLNRDDGASGELDYIDPNVNDVFGGGGDDFISGSATPNVLIGNSGDDALVGNGGDDRINGGNGRDFLSGGADDDLVESVDNAPDTIRCEGGLQDTLTRDLQDIDATGCEIVNSVGVLALAPKALAAKAGEVARLRLSWTHPEAWKKLRKVTLRLRAGDKLVGAIAIRVRAGRIADQGAVKVLRTSRLSRRGGTITARLALRIDAALAGKTLRAEVEAADVSGRRQIERDAATIRVAR